MNRSILASLIVLAAAPALAHPGHDAHPATHWFSDLSHLAVVAGVAALAVIVIGGVVSRRRARRLKGEDRP